MPTRKQALNSKPPAMRVLQIPVTTAFFKAFRNWCTDGDTTIPKFSPPILGAAIGIHHETGKPIRRREGEK